MGFDGFYLEKLRWGKRYSPWERKIIPVEDVKEKKANRTLLSVILFHGPE